MNRKFKVSFHAIDRFRERVENTGNIYTILDKAQPCDEYETMAIDIDYVKFTGDLKRQSKRHIYFKYVDEKGREIIFACVKTGVKEYHVQTCWIRPKFEEPKPPPKVDKRANPLNGRNENTTLNNIIQYLHSKKEWSLDKLVKRIEGHPCPDEVFEYIEEARIKNPDISKEQFMQDMSEFLCYRIMHNRLKLSKRI